MLLALLFGSAPVAAQTPTNAEVYQRQAVTCLLEVPAAAKSFVLRSPSVMPFLESALVTEWGRAGRQVFRTDSLAARPLPALAFSVEHAQTAYESLRWNQLQRKVSFAVRYSFTSELGQILASDQCAREHTDRVRRKDIPSLEAAMYPETVGAPPPPAWTTRYLEPIALGAATVLTVFLFFNLRSSRGSGNG